MKTLSLKPIWIVFILLTILCLSACQSPGPTKPLPDPDTFDLPEIKVEVDMPENFNDPDYTFGLKIDRVGLSKGGDFQYGQSDLVEVIVKGKDNKIFGENQKGEQLVVVETGECGMHCEGEVGYVIMGDIDTHCIMELKITQIGKPATCTSECAPGVELDWFTGVGEFYLEPIVTDFSTLYSGETRKENLGNMEWEATYTLTSFSGEPKIDWCDYVIDID